MQLSSNKYIKTSMVNITTLNKNGKTILEDVYFTAPFKVSPPFYNDSKLTKVIVMSASAGVMEGDVQEYNINVNDNTYLEVTSQSYEKIHKMEEGRASRSCNIFVGSDSLLKYNPLATIPFKGSAFDSDIRVNLKDETSKIILTDIINCGRAACGEKFEYKFYKSYIDIKCNDKLIYVDNTIYDPMMLEMNGFGMFEGYTHLLNILVCNFNKVNENLDLIREIIEHDIYIDGGASLTQNNDISVKILGKSVQKLSEISDRISELFI